MSIGEAHQETAAALADCEREPLRAIGLSASLVAIGLDGRRAQMQP